MVSIENVQSGIAKFIDRDIAPSLTGWDRVLIAGAGGLLSANLPNILAQYADHPVVKALGVYDRENNAVDIDALYNAAKPYLGEPIPLEIPMLKIKIKIGKKELDAIYAYIKEGV